MLAAKRIFFFCVNVGLKLLLGGAILNVKNFSKITIKYASCGGKRGIRSCVQKYYGRFVWLLRSAFLQ